MGHILSKVTNTADRTPSNFSSNTSSNQTTGFANELQNITASLNTAEFAPEPQPRDPIAEQKEQNEFSAKLDYIGSTSKEPNIADHPKLSLLQVPDSHLTNEEIEQQKECFNVLKNLRPTKKGDDPLQVERNLALEAAFWICLFKLAERCPSYEALVDTIRNGEKDKVFDILAYNIDRFSTLATNEKMNIGVRKSKDFETNHEFILEGIKPAYLPPKIDQKHGATEENRKADEILVDLKERTLIRDSLVPTEKSDTARSETPEHGDDTKHDDGETTQQVRESSKNNGSSVQLDTSKASSAVDAFNASMERLMNACNSGTSSESTRTREKQDKIEIEKFDKILQEMYEKDKKEIEEINGSLKTEMDTEIKRYRELAELAIRAEKERQELARRIEEEKEEGHELEFRKRLEEQEKNHKEAIQKLREEREEMERETERIIQENLRDFQERTNAFWSCVQLKLRWEDQEQQWADWLRLLKTSVARAKIQWMKFEDSMRIYGEETDKETMEIELSLLHQKTLAAHDLLYKAFFYLKKLSEQAPGKLFLRILMKNVQKACNTLFIILKHVGTMKITGLKDGVTDGIQDLLNSCEITSTWKLRDTAGKVDPKDYEKISEPLKDEDSGQETSQPNIQEISDDEEEKSSSEHAKISDPLKNEKLGQETPQDVQKIPNNSEPSGATPSDDRSKRESAV